MKFAVLRVIVYFRERLVQLLLFLERYTAAKRPAVELLVRKLALKRNSVAVYSVVDLYHCPPVGTSLVLLYMLLDLALAIGILPVVESVASLYSESLYVLHPKTLRLVRVQAATAKLF